MAYFLASLIYKDTEAWARGGTGSMSLMGSKEEHSTITILAAQGKSGRGERTRRKKWFSTLIHCIESCQPASELRRLKAVSGICCQFALLSELDSTDVWMALPPGTQHRECS